MFSENYRDAIRNEIINKATEDQQITSAAAIGSYARKETDQFSDIDLTFALIEHSDAKETLGTYKNYIKNQFTGEFLFELKQDHTIYGVFLLPGCLQLDLSFTPQKEFGPKAYPFELIFGSHTGEKQVTPPEPIKERFGLIVHHLVRTKVCVERNQLEKANDWVMKAEKYSLELRSSQAEVRNASIGDKNSRIQSKKEILEKLTNSIDNLFKIPIKNKEKQSRIINMLEALKD